MDTRSKIVAACDLTGLGALAVVGRFDLLTAPLVNALESLRDQDRGAPFVAVVVGSEDSILPLRARGEMVAALAVIDYVLVVEATDLEGLLALLQPSRTIDRREADAGLAHDIETHVRNRHSG